MRLSSCVLWTRTMCSYSFTSFYFLLGRKFGSELTNILRVISCPHSIFMRVVGGVDFFLSVIDAWARIPHSAGLLH